MTDKYSACGNPKVKTLKVQHLASATVKTWTRNGRSRNYGMINGVMKLIRKLTRRRNAEIW